MPTNTTDQAIPLPIDADAADNPLAFLNFVAAVEQRLVRLYTNEADRTAKMLTVAENEISGLASENRLDVYSGANHISLHTRGFFAYPRMAADQTLTPSSTALQNVTSLVIALPAAGTFDFESFIIYSATTGADFKFAYTWPAGAAVLWSGLGVVTGGTGAGDGTFSIVNVSDAVIATGGNGLGIGNGVTVRISGTYVAGGTAGNLQFRAAQSVAEASNTVIHAPSWLRAWRVA